MPELSRRALLRAGGGLGVAAAVGGGWYLAERPHCRPRVDSRWTYHGEHWGPAVASASTPASESMNDNTVLVPEGYGVTGGDQYRLVALDSYRGQARWTTVAERGGFGTPTIDGSRVYVGTGVDTVRALDADTGRIEWEYDAGGVEEFGGGAWGRPLVSDDRVYVGISHATDPEAGPTTPEKFTHRLVALERETGAEQWGTEVSTELWAGPVHVANTVVVGAEGGTLTGVEPTTGAGRWSLSLPAGLTHTPFVVGEAITLVCQDGTIVLVDVAAGTIRRTERLPGIEELVAVVRDGDVLVAGGRSGRVVSVAATPESESTRWPVRWTYDANVAVGAVASGDGEYLVVDQAGFLYRVVAGERRGRRARLVDNEYDNRCGLVPDHRHVEAATYVDGNLLVSSGRWLRSVDPRDV